MRVAQLAIGVGLLVLSASSSSAKLIFAGEVRNGVDGVTGLAYPSGVTVSPDGRYVYAVGKDSDSLVVFRHDKSTGLLTLRQVLSDGVDGVDGLYRPVAVAMSADGTSVYVVGTLDDAVAVFKRDQSSGLLEFVTAYLGVGAAQGSTQVASIALSPDGRSVYVGTKRDEFSVLTAVLLGFSRDPVNGTLLLPPDVERDGVNAVTGLESVDSIAVSPANDRVLVLGVHTFVSFGAPGPGKLDYLEQALPDYSKNFTNGAVTYASATDIYAANQTYMSLGHLRPSAPPGRLDLIPPLQSLPFKTGQPVSIAATADGRFVFTSSSINLVGAFRRSLDGSITPSSPGEADLDDVRSIAVSRDSRFLYAVGFNSSNLVVFEIVPDTEPPPIPAVSPVGAVALVALMGIAVVVHLVASRRRANSLATR